MYLASHKQLAAQIERIADISARIGVRHTFPDVIKGSVTSTTTEPAQEAGVHMDADMGIDEQLRQKGCHLL